MSGAYDTDSLGDWAISKELYLYILKVLPYGTGTILELGSGEGTELLSRGYNMISVEHDKRWLDKYNSHYIYAPLCEHKEVKNHKGNVWYNPDVLRSKLEGLEYDLILIDGPPVSRAGFVKYFDLFDPKAIMVFDDLQRYKEMRIVNSIATKLRAPYVVYGAGSTKTFGVINDPCTKR